MPMLLPSKMISPGGGPGDAGDEIEQFRLAVAGDAGNADDFPLAHVERHIVDAGRSLAVAPGKVLHLKHHFARLGRALFDAQQHAAAHHQLGQFFDGGLFGFLGGHHLAAPHDRDMVGDRHDLAQLVGDENDGFSLVAQLAQNAEQVVCLVGREHARGLIKDQRLGTLEEGFENFDALLQAHRQFADDGIRINVELVIMGEAGEFGAGLVEGRADQGAAFGAQHDILQNGERIDQHEMLVHHADAVGDGIGR